MNNIILKQTDYISLNYKNLSKINLQKKKDVFIQTDYLDSELSYTYTIINFNNILSKYYNNNNFLFDIELQNLLDFNNLYITFNNDIKFYKNNILKNFSLIRLKHNFNLLFNLDNYNLYGELVDISIPKLTDELYNLYNNINKNIIQINYLNSRYNIYSIEYNSKDIYQVLFNDFYLPWIDPKYNKRLNRLLILYFFNTLLNYTIEETYNFINDILYHIDNYSQNNIIKSNLLENTILYIYKTIDIIEINIKIKLENIDEIYYSNIFYLEYKNIIKKNLLIFKTVLENIFKYQKSDFIMFYDITYFNRLLTNDF